MTRRKPILRLDRLHELTLTAVLLFASQACAQPQNWKPSKDHLDALEQVTEAQLKSHIRFLSHDLLEGRGPASRGDDLLSCI